MKQQFEGWIANTLRTSDQAPVDQRRRGRVRWPRDARLLMTALACCLPTFASESRGQDTVPWRVTHVEASAYADGGWPRLRNYNHYGYNFINCESSTDTEIQAWYEFTGLQGNFVTAAVVCYECCIFDGYSKYQDCDYYWSSAGSVVSVGASSLSFDSSGCMEYQACSADLAFTIEFDRPMRMIWEACYRHLDSMGCVQCPIDGSSCGSGQAEFPGAGAWIEWVYTEYEGWSIISMYYLESYTVYIEGGPGHTESADIRFERMYPADIIPDGTVNGFDLSAILSKWGSGYDPQRTPEDVNLDGQVSAEDLAAVLFAWGTPG